MFKNFFLPIGIKQLLAINSVVFLLTFLFPWLIPMLAGYTPGNPNFHLYQIITHMFIHSGILHIFFNMFALVIFGVAVEKRVSTLLFWIIYLLCGVGAYISQIIFSTPLDSMVGASGAIFGILTIYTLSFPDEEFFLFFIPIPIKIKFLYAVYILIELLSIHNSDNVGHYAHLGGALTGGIMYYLIKKIEKNAN